jgi:hypothetical protein
MDQVARARDGTQITPICAPPAGRTEGTDPVQNGGYVRAMKAARITEGYRTGQDAARVIGCGELP